MNSTINNKNTFVSQFYCDTGSMAFIIPFLFKNTDGEDKNICTCLFDNIKKQSEFSKDYAFIYHVEKKKLVSILKPEFKQTHAYYNCGLEAELANTAQKCAEDTSGEYKGRNLCKCFSVCRKFHDDSSMNIPRVEIYLGTYNVHYPSDIQNNQQPFEFSFDSLLLLDNEPGNECGYLIFAISLNFNNQKMLYNNKNWNILDNLIFIKHLFYKNLLKCDIKTPEKEYKHVSLQEWTDEYLRKLMKQLGLNPVMAINKHVLKNPQNKNQGAAFSYSVLQLDNIYKFIGENKQPVSVDNVWKFKREYIRQLYGLLVSDEGWRNTSDMEIIPKFRNNHWASRMNSCSFFLGRNVLTIENTDQEIEKSYQEWFGKYIDYDQVTGNNNVGFYKDYVAMHPCFPGVKSLIFFTFLKAIYKDMILGKTKEYLSDSKDSPEEKYHKLTIALQSHSMSLDTIKSVEDRIYNQFNIPAEVENLRERCQIEANNRQNSKMKILTIVTASISLIAIIVSMLSISTNENLLLQRQSPTTIIMYVLLGVASFIFAYGIWAGEKVRFSNWKVWKKIVGFLQV